MDIAPGEPGNPEDKCNSFYRTLAHEFQHMVNFSIQHANGSVEQERWLDEGFSMFSEYVFSGEIGSDPGRVPPAPHFERFLENHGVNLISNARESWFQEESLFRKYGASFLFVAYLVEKFGGHLRPFNSSLPVSLSELFRKALLVLKSCLNTQRRASPRCLSILAWHLSLMTLL